MRSVLERLGSPEEIVAAAADPVPDGQFVPFPSPRPPPKRGLAIASLLFGIFWLGGIGSLAALVLGYRHAARSGARPASSGGPPGHHRDRPGWIGVAALVLAAVAAFFLLAASSTTTGTPTPVASVVPVPSG